MQARELRDQVKEFQKSNRGINRQTEMAIIAARINSLTLRINENSREKEQIVLSLETKFAEFERYLPRTRWLTLDQISNIDMNTRDALDFVNVSKQHCIDQCKKCEGEL
ncbi:hypothetical protein MLD52_04125 [Puniceicoccaceae bacterium K14]|nr:hypothetical protein [Puniceicoccaceae bacterium K14]